MADTREGVITLSIPGVELVGFEAHESLSELFEITVEVIAPDGTVDFYPHLGEPVTLTVLATGDEERYFHGLLFEAEYIEDTNSGLKYQLTLRPWFYILSRNLDYKIWSNEKPKNTIDVIKDVFASRGFSDVDYQQLRHIGDYKPREYCVQYRESDFTFISRLLEEEGIYYFFKHEQGKHTLVLCDDRGSHPKAPYESLEHLPVSGGIENADDRFWKFSERVGTTAEGQVALRDYDFKDHADHPVEASFAGGQRIAAAEKAEVYDYPGDFIETADGVTRSTVILQSARRLRRSIVAEGDAMALSCGSTFKLATHGLARLQTDYIITKMIYRLENQTYRSGEGADNGTPVTIEAIPADTPWRAPFTTPRPIARGPDSAIVTGPKGETIYTDEFGRVKVQFFWDRQGKMDDQSSCWIRVSHHSADKGFGHVILPRIGQEVLVDYLDGDPDSPIIVGRVYNQTHTPTYKLGDNKTRSLWRSQTIGDTGQKYDDTEDPPPQGQPGSIEIRMEDKGGEEELYIHAQRDRKTWVRRDDEFKLGRDQTQRIGHNRKVGIKKDDTLILDEGDQTLTITKGKRTTTIKSHDALTVQEGNVTRKISQGNYSMKIDMGSATIEAMQQIQFKVGQSTLTMTQDKIEIKAMMLNNEAQLTHTLKGLMTEMDGSAMVTVKGAIVMIN